MGAERFDETGETASLERLSSELKGNTLLIYWYMLRHRQPHRSREIQRALGLSSSSLALHHLDKLIELGLVLIDKKGYYVIGQEVRPGLLGLFVGSGRLFTPRYVFYAILNSTLLISCIYLFWGHIDSITILLILILSVNSMIGWIETLRMWRLQPL